MLHLWPFLFCVFLSFFFTVRLYLWAGVWASFYKDQSQRISVIITQLQVSDKNYINSSQGNIFWPMVISFQRLPECILVLKRQVTCKTCVTRWLDWTLRVFFNSNITGLVGAEVELIFNTSESFGESPEPEKVVGVLVEASPNATALFNLTIVPDSIRVIGESTSSPGIFFIPQRAIYLAKAPTNISFVCFFQFVTHSQCL